MKDRWRRTVCATGFVLTFGTTVAAVLLDPTGIIIPEPATVGLCLAFLMIAFLIGLLF